MQNPFDYLDFGSGDLTRSEEIQNTMGSAYQLFLAIGLLGIFVSLVTFGLTIALSGPQKRAEALEELKWKVIASVALFGMSSILGMVLKIAASFG